MITNKEIQLLTDQLNHFKYYLTGSRALALTLPKVETNDKVYCKPTDIHHAVASFVELTGTALDIGCGLRPQRLSPYIKSTLVEPYDEYAERLRLKYPDSTIINSDGISACGMFMDNSFDVVFLLDVIEHLSKDDGRILINEAIRLARKQVVIFTPLGYMPQHHDELDSNLWDGASFGENQDHKSGWEPDEFENAIHFICEGYHGHGFGAFYSVIDTAVQTTQEVKPTLNVLSEVPKDIEMFSSNDIFIADTKFEPNSWDINKLPIRNLITLPFALIHSNQHENSNYLESFILGFKYARDIATSFEGRMNADSEVSKIVLSKLIE